MTVQTRDARPFRLRTTLTVILGAALTLFASGCCKSFDAEVSKRNDEAREWLRNWSGRYNWVEVFAWTSVTGSELPQAEALLHDTPSVQLSREEAFNLINQAISKDWTRKPYLLRAVGDANGKWPQQVFVRQGGEVWVGGGANSRCPVPMQRRAVVVWLDQSPSQVYVTFVVGK